LFHRLANKNLESNWPSCLSVEELTIDGPLDSVIKLSTITCAVKKVVLNNCPPAHIYNLVGKLGPGISHLTIYSKNESSSKLNLHRVLVACPNIEIFEIDECLGPFEIENDEPTFKLSPEHFKNCIR